MALESGARYKGVVQAPLYRSLTGRDMFAAGGLRCGVPLLLVENVALGYFSTDAVRKHVCDVATIDGGYKGGTGEYGPLN